MTVLSHSVSGVPAEWAADLRVARLRTLAGANLWLPRAVLAVELAAGRLGEVAPAALELLGPRFRALLEYPPPREWPAERSWGALVCALTGELQRRAGSPVHIGRLASDEPRDGHWTLVIDFDEEALAAAAVRSAARMVRDVLRGDDPEIEKTVADLTRVYERARPGPTTLVMIEAARARGIPVRRNADDSVVLLGYGTALRRLRATTTDRTSLIATDITSDKHRTKRVLARVGLATPEGEIARTLEGALEIATEIGFPLLLKPLDANNGRGISGRLDSLEEVRAAWPVAVAEHPTVVVERFAAGNDHRVVVVNGRVVAVVERVPAHVVGDGERSIRALAEEVNRDPNRSKTNPSASLSPLPLDERTSAYLARTGLTLASVPAAGEIVNLRATANISTGGTAIDRTDEIHPQNRALCELAAGAVGLDVAGLDVLTPDISVPFSRNGAVIIEVNASPGIRMHTHPDAGVPRDVPGAILDMLYPPGEPTAIPIVAVTGTNGKTTTARLIAHLFTAAGRRTGLTTTDGVYVDGVELLRGDLTGPFAAGIVLSHPQVEVAVLETARGGLLRSGLAFEQCDVGVVTNVTSDHLGLDGCDTLEDLARVKGLVPAAVRSSGAAVLNGDDPLVSAMPTPGRALYFSAAGAGENAFVERALESGGRVARVERIGTADWFVLREGEERIAVAPVADVPLTVGGAAHFQFGNVLAALLAADAAGVSMEVIRRGLRSFVPSVETTPGRLNIFTTTRGRVIVDYAHNVAAIAGLLDFVRALPGERRIVVLTAPGDRRDEDLAAIGRLAVGLDVVIFKEHEHYRRGRDPGAIAALMASAYREAAGDSADPRAFADEAPAVALALEMAGPSDVIAIVADDLEAVLAQVEPFRREKGEPG